MAATDADKGCGARRLPLHICLTSVMVERNRSSVPHVGSAEHMVQEQLLFKVMKCRTWWSLV